MVRACRACGRHATSESTSSLVSGHRFPRDVILLAVRCYLQLGAAAERIAGVLADRGIDVSGRTILRWVQKFGPALAGAVRQRRTSVRRRPGSATSAARTWACPTFSGWSRPSSPGDDPGDAGNRLGLLGYGTLDWYFALAVRRMSAPFASLPEHDRGSLRWWVVEFDTVESPTLMGLVRFPMPKAFRSRVYLPGFRVAATVLVDGFVERTWTTELAKRDAPPTLVIAPFEALSKSN